MPSLEERRDRSPIPAFLVFMAFLFLVGCGDGGDQTAAGSAPAAAPAASATRAAPAPVTGAIDLHLHGGRVVDGSGSEARAADLLIQDGRIVYVGPPVDPDTLEILTSYDAAGKVVAPGFIDAHAHGDPLSTPGFPNFLAQGVTTILLGLDGSSPPAGELAARLAQIEGTGIVPNVAYLVGHNTLRGESGLGFGTAGEDALEPLVERVVAGLDAGAFGLSLGLEYSPGQLADDAELAAIARPVAERGGVIMSHMRTEDSGAVVDAVEELLEVRRRTGARVHVSHLKVVLGSDPAEADVILDRMEDARGPGGAGVTADLYPYLASFTGISILFPDWARPPADYAAVRESRGEELARHLRDRVNARNGPGATLFGTGPWAGRTLEEAATAEGRPFEDLLMELGPGGARAAYFVMASAVMERFLNDPHVAVASDGSPTMGHPRGYGSFARIVREHVMERETLTLEEAVRKMTSLPAAIIGLDDERRVDPRRGRLEVGWAADLVVFDPAQVVDRADFEQPHRLAEGFAGVWVNGVASWEAGTGPVAGARAGRVLRDRGLPQNSAAPPQDLSGTETGPPDNGG